MSRPNPTPQAVSDLWHIVLRFRWRFILPAVVTAALVLTGSLFLPHKYKGEATFERRTDMVLSEIMTRGVPQSFQDPRQSLTEEIAGQPAIDLVIEQLHPQLQDPSEAGRIQRELLRIDLQRKVTVHADIASNDLDRLRVSYIGADAQTVRQVVNLLVENHIERTRKRMEERLHRSSEFFQGEVARSRQSIEELENRKLSFEIEHGELLPDVPNGLQISLLETQGQLASLQQMHDTAAARAAALQQSLAAQPATIPSYTTGANPELVRLDTRLRELRQQLSNAYIVQKMTDKHPEVLVLKEQLAQLEKQISQTPAEVVLQRHVTENPKRAEMQIQLNNALAEQSSIQRQIDALKKQLATMDSQAARIFPVRSEYLKLTRQISESQRQLTFWEDNLRRVEMAMAAESGNRGIQFAFIKPCSPIRKPVSPNLLQVLAAALALSCVAGLLSVFMAYRADESFHRADHLAKALNLHLFGSVSELISGQQRRRRRLRQMVLYPVNALAVACLLALLVGLLYLDLERPQAFEQLKQNPTRIFRTLTALGLAGDAGINRE